MNVRRSKCLLVTIPLLLLTLTASPVAAQEAYYAVSFWFAAKGQCTMGFNPHMADGYSTWDYFERAVGSFVFLGGALATDKVHTEWYGDLYPTVDGTMKAYGWLKASWSHDNEAYGLNLFIYSLPHTVAMIGVDPDIFVTGNLTYNLDLILGYAGAVKRGSVVERVQGRLGFLLVSWTELSGKEFTIEMFHIYSLIDGKDVEFWWANSELRLELPGNQLLVIPAARIFVHEVTVTPL